MDDATRPARVRYDFQMNSTSQLATTLVSQCFNRSLTCHLLGTLGATTTLSVALVPLLDLVSNTTCACSSVETAVVRNASACVAHATCCNS